MSATAENIEQAELSKRYQEQLAGQRLRTALFTTFSFDPGFFEQEVLRLFFDIEVSHSRELRLVKLDDALRDLTARPAVYYDARALTNSDVGSARLDIERHPMRLNGCFHPKIVCALVEAAEADGNGERPQKLIVGCQSANLTRSGWWDNVECCRIETIEAGTKSSFVDPLKKFLRWLAKRSPGDSLAAAEILTFLNKEVTQYERFPKDSLATRFLFTDMAANGRSITKMLLEEAKDELRGMNLEILSPYFDADEGSSPLDELKEGFNLNAKTLRVYLPRDEANQALVSQSVHEKYAEHWGSLPAELLRNGSGRRTVHAKVYRFFKAHPKREIWFLGSVNLTRAAHQPGGNMECGFLVERNLEGQPRPAFLIEPDHSKPPAFAPACDPLEEKATLLTHLTLRYNWSTGEAHAHWALKQESSPILHLTSGGIPLGTLAPLPPNDEWRRLPQDITAALKQRLEATALVAVSDDTGSTAHILVMEDGMSHKPSLLHTLSAADILRYWSMLTPEQRSAFLEERLGLLLLSAAPDDFTLKQAPLSSTHGSLFDRCAGFFHAFHTVEKSVREAVKEKRFTHAITRLFGKKHDSLGHLLDRLESTDDPIQDDVDRHVILLCARQSLDYLRAAEPDFWAEHKSDASALYGRVNALRETTRSRLVTQLDAEFLTWFEKEFLRRESDDHEDD